jgi:hypothetical protein
MFMKSYDKGISVVAVQKRISLRPVFPSVFLETEGFNSAYSPISQAD